MPINQSIDTAAPQSADGTGARILLLEDEMLLSMLMEDALTLQGYQVRKVARVARGLELVAAEDFDAAVLDINLGGEKAFPVAAALRERGVPFLFSSGYGEESVPADYQDRPILRKPFGLDVFQRAVRSLPAGVALPPG